MNIAIVDSSDSRDYDGRTILTEPLGGVQNQIVTISTELAKYHDITVYNNVSIPSMVNGVEYRNVSDLSSARAIDAAICVSYEGTALNPSLKDVPRKIFWKHHDNPFVDVERLDEFFDTVDAFVCISNSSMKRYSEHYRSDKYVVIYNSMDMEPVVNLPRSSRVPHLLYVSCPNRGLRTFVNILPRLHKEAPELELHAYGTFLMYGSGWHNSDKEFRDEDKYKELITMPNFIQETSVPYHKLLNVMGRSLCLTYPSVFVESFGLSILYSMACGLPVVTTEVGSIGEVYNGNKYMIPVPPEDLGQVGMDWYTDQFVEYVLELYYDPVVWKHWSDYGSSLSPRFSVEVVAKEWLRVIEG
jgi:glycosyltransferase involved in cell wall biosynthesis